ncbi:MAG: TIM barrel protein [Phycisphaerales bacterium]|nr:TIM barrel protein [Phycisphaerales bacterium]
MLLTMSLSSPAVVKGLSPQGLLGAPKAVHEQFGLSGLNLSTSVLKGADRASLAGLRDAADRAGCACLVLVEPPLALADPRGNRADEALARARRLVEAASVLGCNSLALGVAGKADDDTFELAVDQLKEVTEAAEKRELNVLISPAEGLTEDPDRVAELIKRVGGFRIGTYPDFQTASRAKDPIAYLRRLAPYAWAVNAATIEFVDLAEEAGLEESGNEDEELDALAELLSAPEHVTYDIDAMVKAIAAVGYDGTLAVDYRGDAGTLGIRQSCEALEAALERLA